MCEQKDKPGDGQETFRDMLCLRIGIASRSESGLRKLRDLLEEHGVMQWVADNPNDAASVILAEMIAQWEPMWPS